ncbi:hypothetical protein BOA8489_03509 [Boseongicola aestuarii]|uniref:Uncharacterized protein n=1 Tax=Boseongicola aestuarii TaxID=1470561 RepID=A0A238J431_9RHOB|nr:hypothetical protein BOA8489_03509 [Boseongicola aestuarii]
MLKGAVTSLQNLFRARDNQDKRLPWAQSSRSLQEAPTTALRTKQKLIVGLTKFLLGLQSVDIHRHSVGTILIYRLTKPGQLSAR